MRRHVDAHAPIGSPHPKQSRSPTGNVGEIHDFRFNPEARLLDGLKVNKIIHKAQKVAASCRNVSGIVDIIVTQRAFTLASDGLRIVDDSGQRHAQRGFETLGEALVDGWSWHEIRPGRRK